MFIVLAIVNDQSIKYGGITNYMKKRAFALVVTFTLSLGMVSNSVSAEIPENHHLYVPLLQELHQLQAMINTEEASSEENIVYGKDTHEIRSGDTLFNISVRYEVTIADLQAWNNLSSDLIYVGDTIAVKASAAKSTPSTVAISPSESDYGEEYTMRATAYTAYCTGCSGITANGTDLRSNPNQKVVAVDPRVIPLGTKVWVEGYGEAIAADTGGAIKGNKIDVFIPTDGQARNWGVRTVTVKILN